MSFEGYYQHWCSKGHYWTGVEFCRQEEDEQELCPDCHAEPTVSVLVDDTNCDSWGLVQPEEVTPAKYETCNLGHAHETEAAQYRLPTEEQIKIARKEGCYPPGKCRLCGWPLTMKCKHERGETY